jgi:hypothetical protein
MGQQVMEKLIFFSLIDEAVVSTHESLYYKIQNIGMNWWHKVIVLMVMALQIVS